MKKLKWFAVVLIIAIGTALPTFALTAFDHVSRRGFGFPSFQQWTAPPRITPRNNKILSMQLIQPAGARPKFLFNGEKFLFDRRNADGLYDLYVADRDGALLGSLTHGRSLAPFHHGNGIFHPSGDYVVFMSEVASHFLDHLAPYGQVPLGDPGLGLFNNLWATNGINYWRLTNSPIKMTAEDGIPAIATVNPRFSKDGSTLIWTERYSEGGNNNWGRWRLKAADFVITPTGPVLQNQRIIYTPQMGTYVTAMDVLAPNRFLVAGNLEGQHEYGMDLYTLQFEDNGSTTLRNLTRTNYVWEEGACVAPSGNIVYMTNRDSSYQIDFSRDWAGQPVERDYWSMNADGSNKRRLTYFNDPSAPEYQGWRSVTIICGFSPDGRNMVATVGRDVGDETRAWVVWQLWMLRFDGPF